ncbi:MAG: DUF5050 domain-containing protein [Bacteroidales bacterium]|nr:DUF5050 domain-containing protein [Bacteroidales bacterium]MDD4822979.1 DUF5050 domain-containing protein [Bacteroidales bacterium]
MKRIYVLLFVITLISGAFAQQTCNNFWTAISPDGHFIYFSSDRHGDNYEIYRVDIDGFSNLMRLTDSDPTINNYFPSLSPDGSKVVFQQNSYGAKAEIFIMNNDGSDLKQLTNNNVMDGMPSFSPDGLHILFSAWDENNYPEIFTMDLDGTNRVQITKVSGANWQSAPRYNPAGDKIYFLAGYNADDHIVMMDLDGSNWVDITPPNSFGYGEGYFSFSPDGSKIVFYTTHYVGYNKGSDVVIANADGSDWVKLTNVVLKDYSSYPVFHPSDGRIFYSYQPSSGKISIKTMNQDGTSVTDILNCSPVGIDELSAEKENVFYPNPAYNILNINSEDAALIQIYDFNGRLMLQSPTGQVDVSSLTSGIYTIHFLDAFYKTIKTGKLIKK